MPVKKQYFTPVAAELQRPNTMQLVPLALLAPIEGSVTNVQQTLACALIGCQRK